MTSYRFEWRFRDGDDWYSQEFNGYETEYAAKEVWGEHWGWEWEDCHRFKTIILALPLQQIKFVDAATGRESPIYVVHSLGGAIAKASGLDDVDAREGNAMRFVGGEWEWYK